MVNKKAEMGIGTLILFIAMILVAAIAAGVLMSTAIGLQSKALLTGKRTKIKVATQVDPVMLYAEDGGDSKVNYFYLKVMLTPGSQPIKFNEMLLGFDTKNTSNDMSYGSHIECNNTNSTHPNSIYNSSNNVNYGVEYLLSAQGGDHTSGYLIRGEIAKLCFASGRNILEDEDVAIQLLPKVGNSVVLDVTLPAIMNIKRVFLYP